MNRYPTPLVFLFVILFAIANAFAGTVPGDGGEEPDAEAQEGQRRVAEQDAFQQILAANAGLANATPEALGTPTEALGVYNIVHRSINIAVAVFPENDPYINQVRVWMRGHLGFEDGTIANEIAGTESQEAIVQTFYNNLLRATTALIAAITTADTDGLEQTINTILNPVLVGPSDADPVEIAVTLATSVVFDGKSN